MHAFRRARSSSCAAMMLRLVGDGEGDAAVRRRAPLAELDLERNEDVGERARDAGGEPARHDRRGVVEVAHEALLREWPRLREWIDEDADGRRLRRHLTHAATDWDTAGRDQGELYRGARLAAALDWSADARARAEPARARVRGREPRRVGAGDEARATHEPAARGCCSPASPSSWRRRSPAASSRSSSAGEARGAETAQLAQRLGAQALVENDLDLSLLLARQAIAIDDTPQTRGSLLAALPRAPAAIGIMHGSEDALLWGIALSPDGTTLAVADFYNGILFFDARTYEQIGEPLDVGRWVECVAYSPDGRTLAIGGGSFVYARRCAHA